VWYQAILIITTEIYVKTEYVALCDKDNDTTQTANIKIVVLQSWHMFTRTRTIAMFYLQCKIVRTCDLFHYLTTINLETFQRIYVTIFTSRYFTWRILKGQPDFTFMFNWHFLSTLNGLDVIRRFVFGLDFPTGGVILESLGKMTPKTSNERKILAERALPCAKLRLLIHCAWNYLYPFGMCRCASK